MRFTYFAYSEYALPKLYTGDVAMKWYGGWLYVNKDEIPELKALGVIGPMEYMPDSGRITKALGKSGTLSHCYCTEETLEKLDEKYGELWQTKYPHYDEYPSRYPSEHFSEIKKGEGNLWDEYLP